MVKRSPSRPVGRPTKLTPEIIEKVRELAEKGLPASMIRHVVGVAESTWDRWITAGASQNASDHQRQFRGAIEAGPSKLASKYLGSLHEQAFNGSVPAITWLLTHHPTIRDEFSDAAADRRVERRVFGITVEAMTAADIPDDYQRRLLLEMQARGLGVI